MAGEKEMSKKNKQDKVANKPQRIQEEKLATSGGFLVAGAYLLITMDMPETMGDWFKFLGIFVGSSFVIFMGIYYGKRFFSKDKQAR